MDEERIDEEKTEESLEEAPKSFKDKLKDFFRRLNPNRDKPKKIKVKSKVYKPLVPVHEVLHRFPGGNVLIPLIIGAIVATVASLCGHPDIWEEVGDPMQTMFSGREGLLGFIGLMIFFTGTQTDVTKLKPMIKRGVPILFLRLGIAYALCFGFLALFGEDGVAGISFLGFTSALTCINSAMFMSVTNGYADDSDRAYFSLAMVFGLPVFPLLAVRAGTGASIDYVAIISILVPMIFGVILGNLDRKMRRFYEYGTQVITMFMGFQFGSYIDLTKAFRQIPQALILILILYLTQLPSLLMERFGMKRSGYATLAMSALAGVSLSMPVLTADIFSAEIQDAATYQLAFALAVTALLAPILTDWANKAFYRSCPDTLKLTAPRLYTHMERESFESYQRAEMKYFKQIAKTFKTEADTEGLSREASTAIGLCSKDLKKEREERFQKALLEIPESERLDLAQSRQDDKDRSLVRLHMVTSQISRERIAALKNLESSTLSTEEKVELIESESIYDPYRRKLSRKLHTELPELSEKDRTSRLLALYDRASLEVDMEEAKSFYRSQLI